MQIHKNAEYINKIVKDHFQMNILSKIVKEIAEYISIFFSRTIFIKLI